MIGRKPVRPPTGAMIPQRQRQLLQTVEQLSRSQGGRGTVQTAGGPQDAPVPIGIILCYAQPTGSIDAATGTWPDLTAGTTTADVYQGVSGSLIQIAVDATINNWGPIATTAGAFLYLTSNGDYTFDVIGQSCPTS
jgi:hypothetical protein